MLLYGGLQGVSITHLSTNFTSLSYQLNRLIPHANTNTALHFKVGLTDLAIFK